MTVSDALPIVWAFTGSAMFVLLVVLVLYLWKKPSFEFTRKLCVSGMLLVVILMMSMALVLDCATNEYMHWLPCGVVIIYALAVMYSVLKSKKGR